LNFEVAREARTEETNMEAKPTPGPWTLDFDTGHVDGANEEIVCYLARGPSDETKTNGRLIAAAPELLDALETLLEKFVNGMDVDYPGERLAQFQPEVKKAEAALRKAKGN
jgi:hypothetical protein